MQVQAINNNLTPTLSQRAMGKNISFSGIFYPKNVNFNKVQKPVADAIKNALREPLHKFKGKTPEDFYKSKGYDFGIEPYYGNSVYLTAYKGMEETGVGADKKCKKYSYLDYVRIGEYGRKSDFKISDVESKIKNKTWADGMLKALLISAVCGMLTTVGLTVKESINTEPLTEKVDSVTNKAKTVLPDTTAVNTKILKTIKK